MGAMKFAICNEIFANWKIEDIFAYAAKVGYQGVEIAPFTIAPYVTEITSSERTSLRSLAKQHGIQISAIHWILAQTEGMHLTHPDSAVRERTARYIMAVVDFCADLGAGYIVVGSPKQRNLTAGVSKGQGWEWALGAFRDAVMRAEERNVVICFEPLASSETNFINTAAEAIEFVGELRTPHFKIILDVKAMSSESLPIPEIIRQSAPHFAYFHANDKNLKGPGFGEVDFHPIAAALKEVNYDGWISVEVFNFDEGPKYIASRSFEYLRTMMA